jgi:hypothetical protein
VAHASRYDGDVLAADHSSQAGRALQLSGMPGFSFQFGRTYKSSLPHLSHFMQERNGSISSAYRSTQIAIS